MLASINLGVYIRFVGAIMRRFTHVNIVNYNYKRAIFTPPALFSCCVIISSSDMQIYITRSKQSRPYIDSDLEGPAKKVGAQKILLGAQGNL